MLGFLLRILVLTFLAVWLAAQPGIVHLTWNSFVLETSTAFLVGFVVVLVVLAALFYRFWRFVWDGPRFWHLRQALHKREKGQRQLGAGFVALAAGRTPDAGRMAALARKQMGDSVAGQFLQACAASKAGDAALAQSLFARLAASPDTASLGYRGLIAGARQAGQWAEMDRLTQLWSRQEPNAPYLHALALESALRRQDWAGAQLALQKGLKARLWPIKTVTRLDAALALAMAQKAWQSGLAKEALEAAEKAVSLAPAWLPARLVLIEALLSAGHERAATRAIENAWQKGPHPDLARLFKTLAPAKKPLEAYKKIEKLVRQHATTPAAQLALAEAALDADLWGEARRLLVKLVQRGEASQATYRLLARLERREKGDEAAAMGWLSKAADALPAPTWLCSACGGNAPSWQAICPHCGAFDRMEWATAGVARIEAENRSFLPAADSLLG